MKILFFYPTNKRTIPIDIPLFKLKERGHEIYLLTTLPRGPLHELYEENGATAHAMDVAGPQPFKLIRQVIQLIRFCRKHQIDTVHSHLQPANIVAVIASFFTSSRINLFRHHCKYHFLLRKTDLRPGRNEIIGDKIVNKLAKNIIVPSDSVRNAMIKYEQVPPQKISIIPYIYDFESMKAIDVADCNSIKSRYPAKLRVIMVSRLTPYKRHEMALKTIMKLLDSGLDIQTLVMDDGPEEQNLKDLVKAAKREDKIHFLGFQRNILEHIAACDVILHPSLTEASNSAIKEAGLLEKIAIVCNEVGDFNDYIAHGVDGYLLNPENFEEESEAVLRQIYENEALKELGVNLKKRVVAKFNISEEIVDLYEVL